MCTVILLHGVNPAHPLIVAANRDETLDRPFSPPAAVAGAPGVVAPRDEVAGGSWMGATTAGFFAALTNRHAPGKAPPRSRGAVVLAALRAGSLDAVTRDLEALALSDYGPFNLIYGAAGAVRVAHAPPGAARVTIEDVPPGLHVLPNGPLNAPLSPKVDRARALVGPDVALPLPELVPRLQRALADHEAANPLAALCVHTPVHGTTSSTILALDVGRVAGYWFCAGPPCRTPLDDVTRLTAPQVPS